MITSLSFLIVATAETLFLGSEFQNSVQELNYNQLQATGNIDPNRIQQVSFVIFRCRPHNIFAWIKNFTQHHLFWWLHIREFKLLKSVHGKVETAGEQYYLVHSRDKLANCFLCKLSV
jgi:hypothetical protein